LRFLRKAIRWNGTPEKITIDKSSANTAAIESHNADHKRGIEIRQVKYLNNIVEQDHRAIKRLRRPMLEFKSFRSAAMTLAGIEHAHDSEGPATDDKRRASSAAILFAGGINSRHSPGVRIPI